VQIDRAGAGLELPNFWAAIDGAKWLLADFWRGKSSAGVVAPHRPQAPRDATLGGNILPPERDGLIAIELRLFRPGISVRRDTMLLAQVVARRDVSEPQANSAASPVRSITISAARALIVIGPNRRSFAKIETASWTADLAPPLRNRWFADSPLKGAGFEPSVPVRQAKLTRSCR
jgi:hypothetical protein